MCIFIQFHVYHILRNTKETLIHAAPQQAFSEIQFASWGNHIGTINQDKNMHSEKKNYAAHRESFGLTEWQQDEEALF